MLEKSINDTRKQLFTKYLFFFLVKVQMIFKCKHKSCQTFLSQGWGGEEKVIPFVVDKVLFKDFPAEGLWTQWQPLTEVVPLSP